MTLEEITSNINNKIKSNSIMIKYTFYELRINLNLTEEETYNFLAAMLYTQFFLISYRKGEMQKAKTGRAHPTSHINCHSRPNRRC